MWHWDWTSITCLVKDLNVNYPSSPNRRRPQINLKIFNPLDKTAIEPSTENFLGHNVENIKALGCFTPEFNWYFRLCDKKITLQNALDKCFSPWKRIVDLLLFWWISKLELNFASAINRLLSSRPCGNILFLSTTRKIEKWHQWSCVFPFLWVDWYKLKSGHATLICATKVERLENVVKSVFHDPLIILTWAHSKKGFNLNCNTFLSLC